MRQFNPFQWEYGKWRKFFLLSACWNMFGAIPALIAPRLNMLIFYGVKTDDFYMLLLNRFAWVAILIFGIGYLIIAYDPKRAVGIIIMGIIGKTCVAVLWYYLFGIDRATIFAVFAATGDSIFTLYFIAFLITNRESSPDTKSL